MTKTNGVDISIRGCAQIVGGKRFSVVLEQYLQSSIIRGILFRSIFYLQKSKKNKVTNKSHMLKLNVNLAYPIRENLQI
jgi:hypothetical protein